MTNLANLSSDDLLSMARNCKNAQLRMYFQGRCYCGEAENPLMLFIPYDEENKHSLNCFFIYCQLCYKGFGRRTKLVRELTDKEYFLLKIMFDKL